MNKFVKRSAMTLAFAGIASLGTGVQYKMQNPEYKTPVENLQEGYYQKVSGGPICSLTKDPPKDTLVTCMYGDKEATTSLNGNLTAFTRVYEGRLLFYSISEPGENIPNELSVNILKDSPLAQEYRMRHDKTSKDVVKEGNFVPESLIHTKKELI